MKNKRNRIPRESEISKWLDEGKVVVIGEEKGIIATNIENRGNVSI